MGTVNIGKQTKIRYGQAVLSALAVSDNLSLSARKIHDSPSHLIMALLTKLLYKLGYVLLFIGLVLDGLMIWIVVTGNFNGLNNILSSWSEGLSSGSSQVPYGSTAVLWNMIDLTYGSWGVVVKAAIMLAPLVILLGLLTLATTLSKLIVDSLVMITKTSYDATAVLICSVVWGLTIVMLWICVQPNIVFSYLTWSIVAAIINITLLLLGSWLGKLLVKKWHIALVL